MKEVKVTREMHLSINRCRLEGMTYKAIAKKFNISVSAAFQHVNTIPPDDTLEKEQAAYELRMLHHLTYQEIAERIGVSNPTARLRVMNHAKRIGIDYEQFMRSTKKNVAYTGRYNKI